MRNAAGNAENRQESGTPQGMRNTAGNAGNAECGVPQGMRNAAGNALVVWGYINEYPCGMPQGMLNTARNAENRTEKLNTVASDKHVLFEVKTSQLRLGAI